MYPPEECLRGREQSPSLTDNNHIWSSSEYSAKNSWFWSYNAQIWDYSNKNNDFSVFFVRAF